MKIFLNDPKDYTKRIVVEAELVKELNDIVLVRLSDGNIIERKKSRDIASNDDKA